MPISPGNEPPSPAWASLTDAGYRELAEAALRRVELALDAATDAADGPDVDAKRTGGLLEMKFASGVMVVVNLQPPLHEIWLAAKTGGYHFKWDGHAWRDTRGGEEFFGLLGRVASDAAGMPLQF